MTLILQQEEKSFLNLIQTISTQIMISKSQGVSNLMLHQVCVKLGMGCVYVDGDLYSSNIVCRYR